MIPTIHLYGFASTEAEWGVRCALDTIKTKPLHGKKYEAEFSNGQIKHCDTHWTAKGNVSVNYWGNWDKRAMRGMELHHDI